MISREVSDGLIDVLIAHARTIPDPSTEIAFAQLGGAVSRVRARRHGVLSPRRAVRD